MQKLVSVNIATHNRAHYLAEAIQSVISQSYQNWELIIVDDASTDNTKEIVQSFLSDKRIKYFLVEKQRNISTIRNIALHKSLGFYIAVLDSDDKWIDNNKLKKQVDFLDNNQEYVLVGTAANIINEEGAVVGQSIKPVLDQDIKKDFFVKNPFFHSSILFKKVIIDDVNSYNENLSFGEDLDLYLRLGLSVKFHNISDVCIAYRKHHDNEANKNTLKAIFDVWHIITKHRKSYKKSIFVYFEKSLLKLKEWFWL